jgi:hypothetical protein
MSEFRGIDGFSAWKKKLEQLLAEGKKAVANDDLDECKAIAARLTEFTIASWPNTPEIKELDRIAAEAADTLGLQVVGGMLTKLAASTGDLARLTKQFDEAAKFNTAEANSIRLKHGREVIDAVTGTVNAINQFRHTLDEKDDKKLLEDLKAVVASLQKLRKTVEDEE